jgi:gluconate 2-dehydrogenase
VNPKILVTRAFFAETLTELRTRFTVQDNQQSDARCSPEELRRFLGDKDGVMLALSDKIDAAALDAAPRLKAVCNVAVGYNNIDVAACTARGILVTNTPGVLDESTADLTWALLLAAARRLPEAERFLRSGQWAGWKNDQFLGVDVHGATLGIIGLGRIGQAVARRAQGFSMQTLYFNRRRLDPAVERSLGVKYTPMSRLLRQADFVSINVPYSAATHHLIGAREIALMKPGAILVNAARGGIVDDAALIAALKGRKIAGAGLDVFEGEPNFAPGFLELDNVAVVPHIGSATRATRLKMVQLAAKNLTAILAGKRPPNLLNPEAWKHRRR